MWVVADPSLFPPITSDSQWLSPADSLAVLVGQYGCSGSYEATHIGGAGAGGPDVAHELAVSTGGAVPARGQLPPSPCRCVCRPLWGACVGGCLGLTLCCRMLSGALLVAVLLRAEQSGMTCIPTLLILLSLTLEMCDFYKKRPILLIIKCDKLTGSRAKESGPATSSNQTS